MKRIIALILALVLLFSLSAVVFAADTEAAEAAERLGSLGLLKGVGTNSDGGTDYDLESGLTREQAVIMLVRLLGKEEEALAGGWEMPFTDVSPWAADYVAYAYSNGLASGTGANTFHGKNPVTAAQYLTFVLRALGYSSETDFTWSSPWALADALGLTGGRSYSTGSSFVRADMAIISSNALDCRIYGSDKTLLSLIPIFRPEVDYTKEDYLNRILSDAELAKLKNADKETLQANISTVADAVAWLDQFNHTFFDSVSDNFEINVELMLALHRREATGPDVYTVITGWCLADDFPEAQYLVASGTVPGGVWAYHSLLLPSGSGYEIINPAQYSQYGNAVLGFDEMTINSLKDIGDKLTPLHAGMADDSNLFIYHLFSAPVGQDKMIFFLDGNYLTGSYNSTELYKISDAELTEREEASMAEWDKIAQELDVADYGLPTIIGNTTLSYHEAKALYKAEPAIIAENVKTVGDVLQYMIAARFSYAAHEVYTPWYGNWGFDAPGYTQLEQNYGCCCGGFANTVSYLLQGDYDEVGTLRWVGGGNHTISWVYTGGQYYVFDFTQLCDGGHFRNYNSAVTVLDNLSDYYDVMPGCYPKDKIEIMVAYEAGDAAYPSGWLDPPNFTGLTYPTEAKGKILTIYQRDSTHGVKYADITINIPGWNS